MKRTLLSLLVASLLSGIALTAAEPRVSRSLLGTAEKSFDTKVADLWRCALCVVGPTRGVYLQGYGVVLTAEINVVTAPISMMGTQMTDKQKVDLRKEKMARLPQLRALMKTALMDAAASLDPLPANEQVVLAVLLPRYSWEDPNGIPMQMIVQATKQQLLDAKRTGADTALRFTEY